MLSKTARRRCLAELRQFGLMLRRLITLMAFALGLQPLASREGRNWFREEAAQPEPRGYAFRLSPSVAGLPPALLCPTYDRFMPRTVPVAPVIAGWNALLDAVKHIDRKAARLARTLQRQRASSLPRPYILPMANMHRLTAELGLIAGALFVQLREAFADWPDTGCPFRDFDEVRRSARGRVRAGLRLPLRHPGIYASKYPGPSADSRPRTWVLAIRYAPAGMTKMGSGIPPALFLALILRNGSRERSRQEPVDVSIQHALRVRRLDLGPQIFHHLVGLQYIGADLVAEADLALAGIGRIGHFAALLQLQLIKP